MYLRRIRAQNYRAFGDEKTAPQLDWTLSPGLNILIGENDAGKTAVVDAIRHILWTNRAAWGEQPNFAVLVENVPTGQHVIPQSN